VAAGFAYAGACSAIICRTSGVQLPPQWPVVAVVRAAICASVHAPSRMQRSIVLYLMLLQRQTVFRPRTAGCTDSDSSPIRSRLTHGGNRDFPPDLPYSR